MLCLSMRHRLNRSESVSPVSLDAVTQEFSRALSHDVDDTAHFYEAGGDSLSMVRVIAGLRSRHGLSITPEEFLAQPTPSGVAAVARPQLDPDVHVLPLSDGTGEPLYLLHPSGGDVLCYMALARAIAVTWRLRVQSRLVRFMPWLTQGWMERRCPSI